MHGPLQLLHRNTKGVAGNQSLFLENHRVRLRPLFDQDIADALDHWIRTADIEVPVKVLDLPGEKCLVDKIFRIGAIITFGNDKNCVIAESSLEFFFTDNIGCCFVGEEQLIISQLPVFMQPAQNGEKRRNARSAGYKIAFPLISYSTPGVVDNEFVSRLQMRNLVCHTVVIAIAFYRELQVRIFIQTGKSKGPLFGLPAGFVDRHFRRLSRHKLVAGGFGKPDAVDVVGYPGDRQYRLYLFHFIYFLNISAGEDPLR